MGFEFKYVDQESETHRKLVRLEKLLSEFILELFLFISQQGGRAKGRAGEPATGRPLCVRWRPFNQPPLTRIV